MDKPFVVTSDGKSEVIPEEAEDIHHLEDSLDFNPDFQSTNQEIVSETVSKLKQTLNEKEKRAKRA